MRFIYSAALLLALTGLSACGLRGDLYLEQPEQPQQSAEPEVDPAYLERSEDNLAVPVTSESELGEPEEEVSVSGMDNAAPAP